MLDLISVSVEFSSGGGVLAVDDVTLTIPDGDKLAILGETGSGKSVLLLAILRLLPPSARASGQVLLDGEDLLCADPRRMRQVRGGLISYVPQGGGGSLNPLLTVGFQVGEPLIEHRGASKAAAIAASIGLLRRFHLVPAGELAHAYPHTFSGGMRQRAMVAMGIAAGARIVLADEPTKGLDPRRVALVEDAFGQLADETVVCVTHDLTFAERVSRHICVMYAGRQIEYGPTAEVCARPLHPYTADLVRALPENGMVYAGPDPEPTASAGCPYRTMCRDRFAACAESPPTFDVEGRKVRCWKYAPGH
ncbi:MAG: ABC transporter ATP-binding protein [Propioniciclava sp.]|uniref:oligopeptide/dipeptide ABC transporter ATP-binding protein n=1 Tax=Propioniciclava sp. TaxID=2038686 RepID=UPI0039E44E64